MKYLDKKARSLIEMAARGMSTWQVCAGSWLPLLSKPNQTFFALAHVIDNANSADLIAVHLLKSVKKFITNTWSK